MSKEKNKNPICYKCMNYKVNYKRNDVCLKNVFIEGHLLTNNVCSEFKRRSSCGYKWSDICRYCNIDDCDITGNITSCSQHPIKKYRPIIDYHIKTKSKKIFKKGCICETCQHCVEFIEYNKIKHKCTYSVNEWTLRTYSIKDCPDYKFILRKYDENDNPIFNHECEDCTSCKNYISDYGKEGACNCNDFYIYKEYINKPCGYYNKTFDISEEQSGKVRKEIYRCHNLHLNTITMSQIIGEIKYGCDKCEHYNGKCDLADGIECNVKNTWRSWKPRKKEIIKTCETCEWNRKSWFTQEYYIENGLSDCVKNKERECHDRKTWKYWKKRSIEPITCKNCDYNLSNEKNHAFELRCKLKNVSIQCQENGWDDWIPISKDKTKEKEEDSIYNQYDHSCMSCEHFKDPSNLSKYTSDIRGICMITKGNEYIHQIPCNDWEARQHKEQEYMTQEMFNDAIKQQQIMKNRINNIKENSDKEIIKIKKEDVKNICNICPESCKIKGNITSCSKTPLEEFNPSQKIKNLNINNEYIKIEVNNMSCEEDEIKLNRIKDELKEVKEYRRNFIKNNIPISSYWDFYYYIDISEGKYIEFDDFLKDHYDEKEIKLIHRLSKIKDDWLFEITIKKKIPLKRKYRRNKTQTFEETQHKKAIDLCYERWQLFEKAVKLLNESIGKYKIFKAKEELEHLTSCKRKPSGENPCFITCEQCGAEMPLDATYCSMCGRKLDL